MLKKIIIAGKLFSGQAFLRNCEIVNNSISHGPSSAWPHHQPSHILEIFLVPSIDNCRISNNQIFSQEAGLPDSWSSYIVHLYPYFSFPPIATIRNCDFIANRLDVQYWTGCIIGGKGAPTFGSGTFSNCRVSQNILRALRSSVVYTSALISFATQQATFTMRNILLDHNQLLSPVAPFSMISVNPSSELANTPPPALQNITLADNSVDGAILTAADAGLIYMKTKAHMSNMALYNNTITNSVGTYIVRDILAASSTLSYSNVDNIVDPAALLCNVDATNPNPAQTPLFESDSYVLSSSSPACIDTGNPAEEYNDPEDPMSFGQAKAPAKGTILNDMGAYGGPGVVHGIGVQGTIGAQGPIGASLP